MPRLNIGKVKSPQGTFRKGQEDLGGVLSALATEAGCGCGIDCCAGFLSLPNFNSSSGDSTPIAMYFVDGEPVYGTIAEAKEAILALKANALISATSATISGCLAATPLIVAATRQLTATVLPSGSLQTGTWSSSNESFATVSNTGLVTAVANGNVTITFTSTDGEFTATCLINVDAA